ncbi:MAG TPA: hypothetical protein VFX38_02440, partial [Gammaproteobacteria bacterium]|nr:hypothetical protein [Gammaproteobacteria bacterium]
MNPLLLARLQALGERARILARELEQPQTAAEPRRFVALSREYSRLASAERGLAEYESLDKALAEATRLAEDGD